MQPYRKAELIAKEYEDFAYIVSHDLNAPLRHIRQFTRLLVDVRKGDLNEDEKKYIGFLENSLNRLDKMQEALLSFSRLTTRAGPLRETNCNKIMEAVLRNMDASLKKYSPQIDCVNLPTLIAEPSQLEILFTALLDNALKFHKDDKALRKILITVSDQEKNWLFEIRDNGIGIENKHYEHVFRLFSRLDPDRYSGIGAGLTIAQKIIKLHNGEIYIDSKPGEGTSVFFSLPKNATANEIKSA